MTLYEEEEMVSLTVKDDLTGMLEQASIKNTKALCLQLLNTPSEQLQGQISYIPEDSGTHFQIQFYLEE
jgi:two-component sensor histidine kinase